MLFALSAELLSISLYCDDHDPTAAAPVIISDNKF